MKNGNEFNKITGKFKKLIFYHSKMTKNIYVK